MTAIGIDLGTTYCCVGVYRNNKVEIIADEMGNRKIPSYVAFNGTARLVGDAAKNQVAINPQNTIFDTKRLIGRRFDDENVQADMKHWPFKVINDCGKPMVQIKVKGKIKEFAPEQISSMVLEKMKEIAESFLGTKVTDAVITVPAYFNDAQRRSTIDAGAIAGLNVLQIINEPTAAALAYGLDKNLKGEKNVMIFDLGGGTFDVSILKIKEGSVFEVISTAGDTHLGGEDFVNRLVGHFVKEFKQKHKQDIKENIRALQRLRKTCENAMRTLLILSEATIEIDSLQEGIDFCTTISRAHFEKITDDLLKSTLKSVQIALKSAKLSKQDIHDVVLVGGSTRILKIQKFLQDFFEGKQLNFSINADEAVAYGAAVQAAILSGDLSSQIQGVRLFDITPFSLGIKTIGYKFSKIFERNSKIPNDIILQFGNQSKIEIKVYEGENALSKDKNLLGTFIHAPCLYTKIYVSFNIDMNGIMNVSVENISGRKIRIINVNGRFSNADIAQMSSEAEKYRDEEVKLKKFKLVRSKLEAYIFESKRAVQDALGNKLTEEDKQKVRESCSSALSWFDTHAHAKTEEHLHCLNYVKRNCDPILSKLQRNKDEILGAEQKHSEQKETEQSQEQRSYSTKTDSSPISESINSCDDDEKQKQCNSNEEYIRKCHELTKGDQQIVCNICSSAIAWFNTSALAEKEKFLSRLNEVKQVCDPILYCKDEIMGAQQKHSEQKETKEQRSYLTKTDSSPISESINSCDDDEKQKQCNSNEEYIRKCQQAVENTRGNELTGEDKQVVRLYVELYSLGLIPVHSQRKKNSSCPSCITIIISLNAYIVECQKTKTHLETN